MSDGGNPGLTDEQCSEALEAKTKFKTATEAAESLGLTRGSFHNRLRRGAQRGLDGSVPEKMPAGFIVKGISTLYDDDGAPRAQWVKASAEDLRRDVVEHITSAFDDYKGHAKLPPAPKHSDKSLLTVYPIADHHLGLYAWAKETGTDYDLDIATRLLRDTMASLVSQSQPSEVGVILNLGDFFHTDDSNNQTSRSGNALDVDTRYAKVLQTGVELIIDCIELALQKHKKVIVRCLPGNHDDHSALALSVALAAFFNKNKRVDVDTDPSLFWWHEHGSVLLGATHGHMAKAKDMGGVMAERCAPAWGRTRHRYIYTGHIHHQTRLEVHGAVCESFQTLAAKDAWTAQMGFTSGRSMCAITHHIDRGECERRTVNVPNMPIGA